MARLAALSLLLGGCCCRPAAAQTDSADAQIFCTGDAEAAASAACLLARSGYTELIDAFEDRGYMTAADVVGAELPDDELVALGLTKMHHRKKFKLSVLQPAREAAAAAEAGGDAASPPPPPPPQGDERPASDPQQLAEAGLEHYKAGRLIDAVEHYQAAADAEAELGSPINVQLIGMLAQLQDAAGQTAEASANYELALNCPAARSAPPAILAKMKVKLGVALCCGTRSSEAVELFGAAMAAKVPFDFHARHAHGMALAKNGRAKDADTEWEIARQLAESQLSEAEAPDTAALLQFHTNLGQTYFNQGRMEDAATAFEAAYKADKKELRCLDMLATIYMHLGRVKKSVTTSNAILRRAPDRALTRGNLALTLGRQGKLKKAVSEAQRAIEDAAEAAAAVGADDHVPDVAYQALFLATWMKGMEGRKKAKNLSLAEAALTDAETRLREAGREKDADKFAVRLGAWKSIVDFTQTQSEEGAANGALRRASSSLAQLGDAVSLALANDKARSGPPGLVLEFGVRYGATLRQIAEVVDAEGEEGTLTHGFDSFEGLPTEWIGEAAGTYSSSGVLPTVSDATRLHVGWFNNTLPSFLSAEASGAPAAFVHLDADLYSSTKEVLDMLAEAGRLVPGTVIEFDEYFVLNDDEGWDQHEARAWQEAAKEHGLAWRFVSYWTQRYSVEIVE